PLRQVAIYSQLLAKEYGARLDGPGTEYLYYCVDGAQRMEMLISDLLAYSQAARGSALPQEPVEIDGIIGASRKNLTAVIRETGAIIETGTLPAVYADRAPLIHVFQHLISNAIKYRSSEPPRIRIQSEPVPGFWRFAVSDNGIGIPKQFQ